MHGKKSEEGARVVYVQMLGEAHDDQTPDVRDRIAEAIKEQSLNVSKESFSVVKLIIADILEKGSGNIG